jgi:hypothetical protein
MDTNAASLRGAAFSLNVIHKGAAKLQHAIRQNEREQWEPYFPNRFIYTFFAFNSLYNVDWYASYDSKEIKSIPKRPVNKKDGSTKWVEEYEAVKQEKYLSFCFQDTTFVRLYKDFFIKCILLDNSKEEVKQILSKIRPDWLPNGAVRNHGYIKGFKDAVEDLLARDSFKKSTLETILDYIYSVRCNIFHGVKEIKAMMEIGQQYRLDIYASFVIALNQMVFSYLDYLIDGEKFTESFDRLYDELMYPDNIPYSRRQDGYISMDNYGDIFFRRDDIDTWSLARLRHSLLLEIQDSPLWKKEAIPDIPLTEEQMVSFVQGYTPDFDCRYAPYMLGGWFYITRSGYWLKKFKYTKQPDGYYHVTEHYTTQKEKGRNLLVEIIAHGHFRTKILDDRLSTLIKELNHKR